MSRPTELTLAAAVATAGIAAMIWWPKDASLPLPPAGETATEDPMADPNETPAPEEPVPSDPQPAEPPEEMPQPQDPPEPAEDVPAPEPYPELPPGPEDDAGIEFTWRPDGWAKLGWRTTVASPATLPRPPASSAHNCFWTRQLALGSVI